MNDNPNNAKLHAAASHFADKVKAWKNGLDPKATAMTARDKEALLTLSQALLDETHPHTSDLVRLEDGRMLFVQRLN